MVHHDAPQVCDFTIFTDLFSNQHRDINQANTTNISMSQEHILHAGSTDKSCSQDVGPWHCSVAHVCVSRSDHQRSTAARGSIA